ncbi:MAG: hypothetical protein WCL50_11165, partial [Spirochaetota bacterium]
MFIQFFLAFGILVLVLGIVSTTWFYFRERTSLLAGIDQKLFAVATMAKDLLPADYHDRIKGAYSVTDATYQSIVQRYNQLCKAMGLEYIWSLIAIDGEIRFTTATSPDKAAENRKHAAFFELHSNPELYWPTFGKMEPVYQINDDNRPIAASPSRAQMGLPDDGFVFCNFNHTNKYTPASFSIWMRLLANIPGSVLWLMEPNALARENIRREALLRSIDPDRLVFAPFVPFDQHLARLPLADLFV